MLRAHRQAWCWQDEYHGLTMDDIRRLERETQLHLAEKMAASKAEDEENADASTSPTLPTAQATTPTSSSSSVNGSGASAAKRPSGSSVHFAEGDGERGGGQGRDFSRSISRESHGSTSTIVSSNSKSGVLPLRQYGQRPSGKSKTNFIHTQDLTHTFQC
jgi:hypothetical protein